MRKISPERLLLFSILIALALSACRKDEGNTAHLFASSPVELSFNVENLTFLMRAKKMNRDANFYTIGLEYEENGILKYLSSFHFVAPINSINIVQKYDGFTTNNLQGTLSTRILDSDVAGNLYDLNDTDTIPDYLSITKFDTLMGIIQGSFQASFIVKPDFHFDIITPDTLTIKAAYFETKIMK